jgi:hypothetical protein
LKQVLGRAPARPKFARWARRQERLLRPCQSQRVRLRQMNPLPPQALLWNHRESQ